MQSLAKGMQLYVAVLVLVLPGSLATESVWFPHAQAEEHATPHPTLRVPGACTHALRVPTPLSAPHRSQNVVPLVISQEVDGSILLGQMKYFSFLAPADQRELTITVTPTFGDPNLYINTGATDCCNVRERGTHVGPRRRRLTQRGWRRPPPLAPPTRDLTRWQ